MCTMLQQMIWVCVEDPAEGAGGTEALVIKGTFQSTFNNVAKWTTICAAFPPIFSHPANFPTPFSIPLLTTEKDNQPCHARSELPTLPYQGIP